MHMKSIDFRIRCTINFFYRRSNAEFDASSNSELRIRAREQLADVFFPHFLILFIPITSYFPFCFLTVLYFLVLYLLEDKTLAKIKKMSQSATLKSLLTFHDKSWHDKQEVGINNFSAEQQVQYKGNSYVNNTNTAYYL